MTTPTALRALHSAIQPLGFQSGSGAEVFHLCAEREKFLVLLDAADALEKQSQALQIEDRGAEKLKYFQRFEQALESAIRTVMLDRQNQPEAALALAAVADLMGVRL